MDTMEMIAKALESVVEEKVAERKPEINLESVLQFVENCSDEEFEKIFQKMRDCDQYPSSGKVRETRCFIDFAEEFIEANDYVARCDLNAEVVDDEGLLEDCFERYVEKSGHLREIIKQLIDEL